MLATELAKAQKEAHAQALWDQIESIVTSLPESPEKIRILHSLVQHKMQLNAPVEKLLHEAESIYNTIEDGSFGKSHSLGVLISILLDAHCYEQVEKLFLTINKYTYEEMGAYDKFMNYFADTEQIERAKRMIHSMNPRSGMKNSMITSLASALARKQQWKQAEGLAHSIKDKDDKARTLEKLVVALAKEQQWEKARKMALSIQNDSERAYALTELIAALIDAQQWSQVDVLLELVMTTIHLINKYKWREKFYLLTKLAASLARGSYTEKARDLWQEAETIVSTTFSDSDKNGGLHTLADAMIQGQALQRAETVAFSMEDDDDKAQIFKQLTATLFSTGEYEQMIALIQRAWLQAETREYAQQALAMALPLTSLRPATGFAFYHALTWTDALLQRKEYTPPEK